MAQDYIIRKSFEIQWLRGQSLRDTLLHETRDQLGISYLPVHGDSFLTRLDDYDLVCYFIFTLSSWWEIPVIDRINSNREDNNFAIIMDINPAPETYFRLGHVDSPGPAIRYKRGLEEMFPGLNSNTADAMYNLLRNGFGHNLFGREPGKIRFDNQYDCPPTLDEDNVLLVPPVRLALSMVTSFLPRIAMLLAFPLHPNMHVFRSYMTGSA